MKLINNNQILCHTDTGMTNAGGEGLIVRRGFLLFEYLLVLNIFQNGKCAKSLTLHHLLRSPTATTAKYPPVSTPVYRHNPLHCYTATPTDHPHILPSPDCNVCTVNIYSTAWPYKYQLDDSHVPRIDGRHFRAPFVRHMRNDTASTSGDFHAGVVSFG